MADDELTAQLKRWGHALNNRYAWGDRDIGEHVLARNRDMAPGTKEKAEVQLVGRDGKERRRFMAKATGIRGLTMLPEWAVDPVRSANDADAPHDREASAVDMGVPDDLRWIESAVNQLKRKHPVRALCLHEEFCGVGTQYMKASQVARQYGGKVSVWMYRRELQRALDWLRAKAA